MAQETAPPPAAPVAPATQTKPVPGAPAAPGPVRAEPSKIDFGIRSPGSTADGTVTLVNTLDRPLKIVKATPSCQCTGVDVLGKEVPANGKLTFPISIKLSKAPVKKQADLKIMFEGFPAFVLRVELEAEVAYPIRATPGFLDIQQSVSPAMPLSGTFTLAASDGKPFSIIAVQGAAPPYVDFVPGKDAPRASYTLSYNFTETVQANSGRTVPPYVVVETDRADCPLVDLRVRHESTHISPKFKVHEFRSTLGRIAPGEAGEFELEIENMKSQRITGVRSLSPKATAELVEQTSDEKGSVNIKVKVTPAAGFTGLLFFPVEISAGAVSSRQLVIGSVR